MDYPKSVPSAGLVNGKFVDEDAINGTPGSLIPAAWGNGVTEEVVNVIKAAAIVPDEQNHGQLQQAIIKNISDRLPGQASETVAGIMKVATQDQVGSGVDDTVAVTPKGSHGCTAPRRVGKRRKHHPVSRAIRGVAAISPRPAQLALIDAVSSHVRTPCAVGCRHRHCEKSPDQVRAQLYRRDGV